MKKLLITLLAVSLLPLGSCNRNPVETTPPDATFSTTKSEVAREAPSASTANISRQAESNNEFAVRMFKLLGKEDNNLFFSPYSITCALAMTAAGAAGDTRQQIRDALQVKLDGDEFDKAINDIDLSLMNNTDNGVTLNVINSIWIRNGWDFRIGYLDHLARYYGAGVNLLDFLAKPEESRIIINDWVAKQTNDKILDLMPQGSINTGTVAVLTNAIYFLADWQNSFRADLTKNSSFYLLNKSTIEAPRMFFVDAGNKVTMSYARKSGARALDFPYKGDRLAMTVIMPDVDSFPSFENSLTTSRINELVAALHPESLSVSLPKFQFTSGSISLVEAFQTLGMKDAFEDGIADFSGMDGTKRLYVSDILHKAFIAVDEKGTEAAAATGVAMSTTSINPDVVEFNVHRPFIFIIRDKVTGTILFMGKILNPLLSQ